MRAVLWVSRIATSRGNCHLNPALPFLNVFFRRRRVAFDLTDFATEIGHARCLVANQSKKSRCETPADLRQIDAL